MKRVSIAIPLALLAACDAPADQADQPVPPSPAATTSPPTSGTVVSSAAAPDADQASGRAPSTEELTLTGEWIEVGAECIRASGDDYVEGANLRIAKTSISGFEWGCDLQPAIGSEPSYRGTKVCFGDGEDGTPDALSLDILADGTLKMTDRNGTQILRRCPK